MAFLKNIFKKEEKTPRGFHELTVSKVEKLCGNTVVVTFDIKDELKSKFAFKPGQYVTIAVSQKGEQVRRSYSICSSPEEGLSIACKRVENGLVSNWLFEHAQADMKMFVSEPEGNFLVPEGARNVVAFTAGSGITPILSIAKSFDGENLRLYYGNRTSGEILFKSELDQLDHSTRYFLTREKKEGYEEGRITKDLVSKLVKEDLSMLRADAFLICGPEEMIISVTEALKLFGVSKEKIIYELFTTPVILATETKPKGPSYTGDAEVTFIMDREKETTTVSSKTVLLDAALDEGLDAPYSCRGGVCSTCKAKVIEGKARMRMNYVLTDKEVEEGFVLSCQTLPDSEKLTITFDV